MGSHIRLVSNHRTFAALSRCSFFFFILRPPPSSTLFPYTTLFRSRELMRLGRGAGRLSLMVLAIGLVLAAGASDRKSTRLNSSHLGISYAVFCLKKKINNEVILSMNGNCRLGSLSIRTRDGEAQGL